MQNKHMKISPIIPCPIPMNCPFEAACVGHFFLPGSECEKFQNAIAQAVSESSISLRMVVGIIEQFQEVRND